MQIKAENTPAVGVFCHSCLCHQSTQTLMVFGDCTRILLLKARINCLREVLIYDDYEQNSQKNFQHLANTGIIIWNKLTTHM